MFSPRTRRNRRQILAASSLALALPAIWGGAAAEVRAATRGAAKKAHRLAVQVNANDAAMMTLALNNVNNVIQHYRDAGEDVEVEIVAFGPGLHMLREDSSPIKSRIKLMSEAMPNVTFAACGNTHANMTKAEGKDIPLVPQAKMVKSGVVRLIELQESGWSYVRP